MDAADLEFAFQARMGLVRLAAREVCFTTHPGVFVGRSSGGYRKLQFNPMWTNECAAIDISVDIRSAHSARCDSGCSDRCSCLQRYCHAAIPGRDRCLLNFVQKM